MPTRYYVLDNTLGAEFVGVIVAATLYGISLVQAWFYYTHQHDSWPIRLLVGAVMAIDTTHQMLITHTVYTYTITNWGNPAILELIVWSLAAEVIFNGLTALLVQCFLARRVWRLSHGNKLLTGLVMLLVLGEFAAVMAFVSIELQLKTYAELKGLKYLSILVNVLAAAGDILIAAALCILLHRSRTSSQRSNKIINKLILFAVNTGVLTSLCAVASLISILAAGKTFLYIAFYFCIGRLYTNSLLATLNARKKILTTASEVPPTSISLSDFPSTSTTSVGRRRLTNISLMVETTQEFTTDEFEKEEYTTSRLENTESVGSSSGRVERKETEPV